MSEHGIPTGSLYKYITLLELIFSFGSRAYMLAGTNLTIGH